MVGLSRTELLMCVLLYLLALTVFMGMLTFSPLGYPSMLADGAYYYIVQHGYNTLCPPSASLFPWAPPLFVVAAVPAWVLGLSTLQTLQLVYPALFSLTPVLVYVVARSYTGMRYALAGGVYAALSPAQLLSFGYTYYKFAFAELIFVLILIALLRFEKLKETCWLGAAGGLLLALVASHPAVAGAGLVLFVLSIAQLRAHIRPTGAALLLLLAAAGALLMQVVGRMYTVGFSVSIGQGGYFVSPIELMCAHPAVAFALVLGIAGVASVLKSSGVKRAVAVIAVLLLLNGALGILFYDRYFVLADLLVAMLMPLGLVFIERHGRAYALGAYGVLALLLLFSLPSLVVANGVSAPSCDEVGACMYLSTLEGTVLTDELRAPWVCALSGMDCPMLPFDARREEALVAYYHESAPALSPPVYVVVDGGGPAFNATTLLDTGGVRVMRLQ